LTKEKKVMIITTPSVGGVVRERGGPQPLEKSTRDTELIIQGARLLKNSMAS
jgi:hypothetical protein